jgi:hypothetical protein
MSAIALGPTCGISSSRRSDIARTSPTVVTPMRCSAFSHRRRNTDRANATSSSVFVQAGIPGNDRGSSPGEATWRGLAGAIALADMAARQHLNIDLDAEVASILRSHAAEAHVSEGEIVDRAIRAYDLRALITRIRERSDLDEDAAIALVREELHAARAERDAAA